MAVQQIARHKIAAGEQRSGHSKELRRATGWCIRAVRLAAVWLIRGMVRRGSPASRNLLNHLIGFLLCRATLTASDIGFLYKMFRLALAHEMAPLNLNADF